MTGPTFPYPRSLVRLLLALAGMTLVFALVAICVRIGSAWPWMQVVHEDGVRTLLETIFYVEHATRELPLDLLLGVAIGGCVFFAFPPGALAPSPRDGRRAPLLAVLSVMVVAGVLAGAAMVVGPASVLENLLQNHTRPGADLSWGSHWRYHLLERGALILIVIGLAGLLRAFVDGGRGSEGRSGLNVALGVVAFYLLLTLVFAQSPAAMLQPFRDPQYLGHQAREFVTHALVSVPIGWGLCMLMLTRAELRASSSVLRRPSVVARPVIGALILGGVGVLIGGFVGFAAMRSNAVAHGQTNDLAMLIFPHFFEHSITYVVVPLVAALTFELIARRAAARSKHADGAVLTGRAPD